MKSSPFPLILLAAANFHLHINRGKFLIRGLTNPVAITMRISAVNFPARNSQSCPAAKRMAHNSDLIRVNQGAKERISQKTINDQADLLRPVIRIFQISKLVRKQRGNSIS